jgi:MYXO-CTERM domain-containing protein
LAYHGGTVPFLRYVPSFVSGLLVLSPVLVGCGPEDEGLELLERAAMSSAVPAFEGRFETRIADMLDGTSRRFHVLVAGAEEMEVVLDPSMEIARDAIVRVWGDEIEQGVIEVESYEVVAHPTAPLIDPEPRPHRRIATVLLTWEGAMQINNPTARDRMFLGSDSTNVFYGENSYGIDKMAGNVFGPYEIPHPGSCSAAVIASSGMTAFKERGHKEEDYRQFMWVFPSLSCGWGGLGSVGSPDFPARDSWYNGSFGCVVRNQEIGHNYGMGHSHAYQGCTDEDGNPVPFSDIGCEHIEYGDPYDPMGGSVHGSSACAHMNVVQKTFMRWISECNVVRATADDTFNLVPTELPCNGTQALRFPAFDGRDYWLEYRTPRGFDSHLSGVLVHVSGEVAGNGPSPYILRITPNHLLHEGDAYTDPGGTVTFTVLEEHPTHAVISATFPDGGSGSPECRNGSSPIEEAGAVGSLECADEPFPLDTAPPNIQIVYPEHEAYVTPGSSFDIIAEASDDRGVTELELFFSIDGADPIKVDSIFDPQPGCEGEPDEVCPWSWPVVNIPEGTYELGVRAWDGPNWTETWVEEGRGHVIYVTHDIPPEEEPQEPEEPEEPEVPEEPEETTGSDDEPGQDDAGGCGCRHTPAGGTTLALLTLALAATRRRRA